MKTRYIKPTVVAVSLDSAELFLQSSDDKPAQAYNRYSDDDACAKEQRQSTLWDNAW